MVLDVMCGYELLFLLDIKVENMQNGCLLLASDHLYGKWLFTWLSLMMSLMVSDFMLSFFPRDVLDEIWDCIDSVPKDFTYLLLFHPKFMINAMTLILT